MPARTELEWEQAGIEWRGRIAELEKELEEAEGQVDALEIDGMRLDLLHRLIKAKVEVIYFGGVTNLFYVDGKRGRTLREAVDRANGGE